MATKKHAVYFIDMHSSLVLLLQKYQPSDDEDTRHQSQMVSYAQSLPEPFSRHQLPGHFTGSALILDASWQSVCLVFHRKLNRWLQPGGHGDALDENDIVKTALREAREETSLTVSLLSEVPISLDIHRIPARPDEPAHDHLDVRFLVSVPDAVALSHDALESAASGWFTFEEAERRVAERGFSRMLSRAAQWIRQPR